MEGKPCCQSRRDSSRSSMETVALEQYAWYWRRQKYFLRASSGRRKVNHLRSTRQYRCVNPSVRYFSRVEKSLGGNRSQIVRTQHDRTQCGIVRSARSECYVHIEWWRSRAMNISTLTAVQWWIETENESQTIERPDISEMSPQTPLSPCGVTTTTNTFKRQGGE